MEPLFPKERSPVLELVSDFCLCLLSFFVPTYKVCHSNNGAELEYICAIKDMLVQNTFHPQDVLSCYLWLTITLIKAQHNEDLLDLSALITFIPSWQT